MTVCISVRKPTPPVHSAMMSAHYNPPASSSPTKSSGSSESSVTPPKARVAPPHAHHPHPLPAQPNPYIQTSQPQYSHGHHSHIGETRYTERNIRKINSFSYGVMRNTMIQDRVIFRIVHSPLHVQLRAKIYPNNILYIISYFMPLTVVFLWHKTFLLPALTIVRFHQLKHISQPMSTLLISKSLTGD